MKRFANKYPHFPFCKYHLQKYKIIQIGITQPLGIAQYETEQLFADVASLLEDMEIDLE